MSKRAIVFGASGISGWSFVNEILNNYPEPDVWKSVVAVTNRPLQQEDSLWPNHQRLQIVSGVDLLGSQENVETALKDNMGDVDKITHCFYLAYRASTDMEKEIEDAVNMIKRATTAVDRLSPALEFVVLQTGAKAYGIHLPADHRPEDYIRAPYSEDLPRLKAPYHDMLFYYHQVDWLSEYAKDKKWNWCETRPDVIIGFAPSQNFFNLAQTLGIHLALYAVVEGKGADIPFPGTPKSWTAKFHTSSSDMIARQTIHLSLNMPASQRGEAFNVADAKKWSTWIEIWPQMTQYFGFKGTGPPSDAKDIMNVRQYINDHLDVWRELEERQQLKKGVASAEPHIAGFEYYMLAMFDFDRQFDMNKTYSTPPDKPFGEERNAMQVWGRVFDRMREAKLIPMDEKAR